MVWPISDWDSSIWRHLRFRHGASQRTRTRTRTRTLWKAELARSMSPDYRPNDKAGFLSEPGRSWWDAEIAGLASRVCCLQSVQTLCGKMGGNVVVSALLPISINHSIILFAKP